MADSSFLDWPFFEERHRKLAKDLEAWASAHLAASHDANIDEACRKLVRELGSGGWLKYAIGGTAYGAAADNIDTRALCIIRETLARHSGLADFAFAMQGLGSGAITLFGTEAQKQKYLPRVASGASIAAFALSEPEAGSDAAAMQCEATQRGDSYELNGEKTFISNGGIADFYVLFARTTESGGSRGITAFIVDAKTPGLEIAERIQVMAPHPLARLKFTNCRIAVSQRLGEAGSRIQSGDGDAGRVSHFGGCRGDWIRAPRARRSFAARHFAQNVRANAGGFSVDASKARGDGNRN